MPRDPYISSPSPPLGGGDALDLADLALARGDAFDAAAQYRALLPSLDARTAEYAKLRLARAYISLGELERAQDALYEIAGTKGEVGWVALTDLAELRTLRVGARAALSELAVIAGTRYELLVDHLIHSVPDEVAAELLLEKAARVGHCDYVFAAIRLHPGVRTALLGHACGSTVVVARRWHAARVREMEILDYYRSLEPFIPRWDTLAADTLAGDRDAAPWIALGEDLAALRAVTGTATNESLDAIVRAALLVALELSAARVPRDRGELQRIRNVVDRLGITARGLMEEHLDARRAPVRDP